MTHDGRPEISLIAALDENGVIGYQGGVPWRLPEDMRWFRQVTMGKPVIMGRKTYESIGKPLRGRHNIVVTRQAGYQAPGCEVVDSPEAALATADGTGATEIMVIGGAMIYAALLPQASRLYLTYVKGCFRGDTFFPPVDMNEWAVESERTFRADQEHDTSFRIVVLARTHAPAPWPLTSLPSRAKSGRRPWLTEEE